MVSKKRLDYGFNGFRAPIIPRAPRSNRRRGPSRKSVEDNKLCAFELLADVAGKLLQESESSTSSNVAEGKVHLGISLIEIDKGRPADDKALKSESYGHGSCAESSFVPDISVRESSLLYNLQGVTQAENGSVLDRTSVHASSDFLKKVDCDIKLGICEDMNTGGVRVGDAICVGDSFKHKVETGPETQSEDDISHIGDLSMANTSTVKDPIGEHVNTNLLINAGNSVQLPLYRDHSIGALSRKHWNNVKLGIRDDDDNYFGCNKFSTKIRAFRPQPRYGHHRIRKTLTSKYWKAAPKLKEYELYKTNDGMKAFHWYRKNIYARDRCQQVPIKKRKFSDHSFAVAYDQVTSNGSISNFPKKGKRGDKTNSAVILHRATGASAATKGHQKMKDPHVKLSIKSFRVPELYVEVPEAATVGSLKKTVMDAVTAILGSGIRVGVVLQGKKVRDDSRTLQQAGISQSNILDTLGFTLEPSSKPVSPSTTPKKSPLVLPCDADQQFPRSPTTPVIDSGVLNASVDAPLVTKLDNDVDNNEFVSPPITPTESPMDGAIVPETKALVPVSPVKLEALAVVPMNSKPKRSELSQRRIRRPFSVAEVEALVEAIEKLGTGRWRDVKMRAFENADHRTYVDLKDKWKTLVHTATISPQQRRGEPVPQELLDRVLSVHSYWLQNQPKLHGKHLVEPLKIVDASKEIEGSDLLTVNL